MTFIIDVIMYKVDLPIDCKESETIEFRRKKEQERQARIFDAKARLIGIDKQAIEEQIKDKELRNKQEKLRDEAYAADAIRNDKIACLLEKRQQRDKYEINKSLNSFRLLHQQPDTRREFDLYDPNALKNDRPARICDDDPRCGVSSIQKFDGEDLNEKARNQYQRTQMRDWFERQIEERKRAEAATNEAERLNALKQRELDQRVCELANAEKECRRAINLAVRRFNEALRAEQEQRFREKLKQEQDDNMTEICNAIYSDFLTENPAQATSAFGPNRYIPDRFKGMPPEAVGDIRKTQKEQMKERERIRREEQQRNTEWDMQRMKSAHLGILIEREIERCTKEIKKKLAQENLKLALDQKAFQKYLNSEVYTNQPTAEYFNQFNTTSR